MSGNESALFKWLISRRKRNHASANFCATEVLGTLIGAIAGGGKGVAIGAVAGAGAGTQVLTRGKTVKVPAETTLRFKLDQPLDVASGVLTAIFRVMRPLKAYRMNRTARIYAGAVQNFDCSVFRRCRYEPAVFSI